MKVSGLIFPAFLLAFLGLLIAPENALGDVSSLHHDMEVHLDPQTRSISVVDRLQVQGGGETIIHLASNMIITGIRVNNQTATHSRNGETLRLNLETTGENHIQIEYRGTLSDLPSIPGTFDSVPMIASPKGSYLSAASAWHPIIRGVAATYRISLVLPDSQKAVVPGRLVEEGVNEGQYRAVFNSEIPSEGIVLIAGPFVVQERQHGELVLRTYFPPGLEDLSPGYLESTAGYIDLYSERIGDYPFSSFFIVSGPLPVGLGFPGMTYIGERVLKLPFIRFTSLGHEVLHNWWGNGVEVDYRQGNWAEGLTTYMADYAFAGARDESNFTRMRTEWLRDYAALPPRRDLPVRSFISRRHDAAQIIGYNKVAFIFHMLKRRLGNELFGQGIKNFWEQYKFKVAGWKNIQNTFEKASGHKLGVFFNQWIDRSGAPRLVLSDLNFSSENISFILTQPELSYDLNVPIRLITEEGENMYQAGIRDKASRIELPLSAPPVSISIDPGFDIFRRLDATEAPPILRDTTLDADSLVIFIGSEKAMEQTSKNLAGRLLDGRPIFGDASDLSKHEGSLLIIGATLNIQQFLHETNLPDTPKSLVGRGTARVWAARRKNTQGTPRPLLVIEANDNEALKSLLRPLPHYGRRGYLVFNGRKAVDDGVWPAQAGPLTVIFDRD
jgi:aminopeptidase N